MKMFLSLVYAMIILQAAAQESEPAYRKISPNFISVKNSLNQDSSRPFFVVAKNIEKLKEFLVEKNLFQFIISEYSKSNLLVLTVTVRQIDSILLPSSLVHFIDPIRTPKEEIIIDGFDLSPNKINQVHDRFTLINGKGTVVSVKENKPDSTDIDLKGRFISTSLTSSKSTSHATIMSTIIAGAGNSYFTGKGVSWGAEITSSDFANLLPDANLDYKLYNISVQNHSYGTGIENYYGADAAAYDASTISNPSLIHVFSAGNSGDMASIAGPYAGIDRYANLTGSFKMAKNIITVGGIDPFYNISSMSSRGPTYDGRVRPELVAFGQDGSSGAAALVSGTALLLQQVYKEQNSGLLPSSALIKSVLLNSADDIGAKGIDFQSGFGNLNAYNALVGIINQQYFSGDLSQGLVQEFRLNVPLNVQQLKITICWNDPPAKANDDKSLINDIDIKVIHPQSGNYWHPWVLNKFPHVDSLNQIAVRKKDSVNNIEHITIDNPSSGSYVIEVKGYKISSGVQSYYISYQWNTMNQFEWQFPMSRDNLFGSSNTTIRWASTFTTPSGKLYYSTDLGKSWNLISADVDLKKKNYQWKVPDTFSTVMLQMMIGNQIFISDTSTISSRLKTGVGYNCVDSFLIHWSKASNNDSYIVYQLGKKYLEPINSVNDTGLVLHKSTHASLHYSIGTMINGKPGLKSYTFNYTTQGIGCYIKSYIVDLLNSNEGHIQLELGTTFNVQDILIEKWSRNGFFTIQKIPLTSALRYTFIDNKLLTGGNVYRIRINLINGKKVYSQSETIYYLNGINYLVYPNPAKTDFVIVSKDTDNTELIVYNTTGQKILVKKITSTVQNISVRNLKRGMHFILIKSKEKKVFQGSILIQ